MSPHRALWIASTGDPATLRHHLRRLARGSVAHYIVRSVLCQTEANVSRAVAALGEARRRADQADLDVLDELIGPLWVSLARYDDVDRLLERAPHSPRYALSRRALRSVVAAARGELAKASPMPPLDATTTFLRPFRTSGAGSRRITPELTRKRSSGNWARRKCCDESGPTGGRRSRTRFFTPSITQSPATRRPLTNSLNSKSSRHGLAATRQSRSRAWSRSTNSPRSLRTIRRSSPCARSSANERCPSNTANDSQMGSLMRFPTLGIVTSRRFAQTSSSCKRSIPGQNTRQLFVTHCGLLRMHP